MTRLATVRTRYVVGSVVVDGLVVGVVLALAYWATLPIRWPSDPLFPRYFVSFFASLYGWVVTGCIAAVWVTVQVLDTRWSLRFVDQRVPRVRWLASALVFGCVVSVVFVATLLGDVVKALFLLVAVGILLPAFWPSYVVVRRWERQHQQILLMRGFSLHAVPKR